MPRIAFVTDSSCGLPPECVRDEGIRIVPLDVIVDSDVRPDLTSSCGLPPECVRDQGIRIVPLDVIVDSDVRPDLTSTQLISALERGHKVTTSRPTPEDFLDVYQQLHTEGFEAIVVTTLSSTLSGTYESALLASKEIELPVRVVDSRNVGLGFGFAVLNASRETADLDIDTVARSISVQSAASAVYFYLDSLEYLRKGGRITATSAFIGTALSVTVQSAASAVYFYLDSLEYLRRGGRITATSAFIGTALSVKPILQMRNGEIAPCTKVRTQSKALARLVELALESSGPKSATQFGVQHLGAPDHAQHCVDLLHAARPDAEILLSEVTAVVGAHAGPGLVAVIASGKSSQGTISSTDD